MKTPFEFGRVVVGSTFINREAEIKKLKANFLNNINTILVSPRRWGKSSLVKQTSLLFENEHPEIRFVFIDLFNVRSEEQFFKLFAKKVIQSSSTKLEEWIEDAKTFISRLTPRISVGIDPINDFEIGFDIKSVLSDPTEILDLPEKMAVKKNIRLIICIDEFQNIGFFEDPLSFQKQLRSVWQHQKQVTYCMFGSKRHMMLEIFEKKSFPFYKFGPVISLPKIKSEHFIHFITSSFTQTGKTINPALAENIVNSVKSHPYYVQQLSHIVWENTDTIVNQDIIQESIDELITTNSILYESEAESLSNTQINLLKAITKGEIQISANQVMLDYNLGSSANVIKNKRALERKEILNKDNGNFEFEDPVFEIWFNKKFI